MKYNSNNSGIFPLVKRIVAFGDIHGDFNALINVLKKANIINNNYDWIAGNTYLVQTGDILDSKNRGGGLWKSNQEKKVINFLINLREKAEKYRGKVILLIGNHEIMNILGMFNYASNNDIKSYGGIKKRKEYFSIPNGYFIKNYANKSYVICKIGDWVFSHAGILPKLSNLYDIEILNNNFQLFIKNKLSPINNKKFINILIGKFGILNYRGYGIDSPNCKIISSSLKNLGAKSFVIGHSPQDKINSKCNKKLWRIDTAMSRSFGNDNLKRIQCLEIINNGQIIKII